MRRRIISKRVRISVPRIKSYRCSCGRELIPITNPSKCPHCGRVTRIIG